MAKKGGLGRGIDSLFLDNSAAGGASSTVTLSINEIEPNRAQPRKQFDEKALEELAKSIEKNGVLQPLLVRPRADGSYQLIAGERRWRASRMAGLREVPVTVREMTDEEADIFALIENLQREDLNPLEEATGLKSLIETYGLTQEEAAERVGKSRVAVTNTLRLLKLPQAIMDMVVDGRLSAGHSRALLGLETPEEMERIADMVVSEGASVRQTEKMVKAAQRGAKARPAGRDKKRDSFYDEVELALTEAMGRTVRVKVLSDGRGTLEFEFFNKDDLSKTVKQLEKLED